MSRLEKIDMSKTQPKNTPDLVKPRRKLYKDLVAKLRAFLKNPVLKFEEWV